MASLGATVLAPLSGTVPRLGVIVTEVAPMTSHSKVDDSPSSITVGLAEKLSMKGWPVVGITVKVTEVVTDPASLVAVRV